ncbi:MAG: J domain-containing protein [Ahrensia sp.]
MFNSASNKLDVTIKMVDGTTVSGKIVAGLSSGLLAAINKEQPFIEIVDDSGVKRCLGQSHIVSVEETRPFTQPDAPVVTSANAQNAFSMLGLKPECSAEEAQQRYHLMIKKYHPDKFRSVELPFEVSTYLDAMTQELSIAYKIISQEIEKKRAA